MKLVAEKLEKSYFPFKTSMLCLQYFGLKSLIKEKQILIKSASSLCLPSIKTSKYVHTYTYIYIGMHTYINSTAVEKAKA